MLFRSIRIAQDLDQLVTRRQHTLAQLGARRPKPGVDCGKLPTLIDAEAQIVLQRRQARRSGLRRALVGVESGDPQMLADIQKDITVEQVLITAERCRRFGIKGVFPFIVGMPGETDESVRATFALAR